MSLNVERCPTQTGEMPHCKHPLPVEVTTGGTVHRFRCCWCGQTEEYRQSHAGQSITLPATPAHGPHVHFQVIV